MRDVPEDPCPLRTAFQRDRDRIIHTKAFRRLKHKTQVFVEHDGDAYRGDYFRTRLTHSLEVAQVARTVARAIGLSEPLAVAICLAHDLGHTPFGHAGQDALNDCMRGYGGFEHNLQSLRVVDEQGADSAPGVPGRIFVGSGLAFAGYTVGSDKDRLDGLVATEWATAGDGDDAWVELELAATTTLDLTVGWRFNEGWRVDAGLSNAGNSAYLEWTDVRGRPASDPLLDLYYQPGRNWALSVTASF